MGHEEQRTARSAGRTQLLQAAELERRVAHRQSLIDEQHLGIEVDHHREAQPIRMPLLKVRTGVSATAVSSAYRITSSTLDHAVALRSRGADGLDVLPPGQDGSNPAFGSSRAPILRSATTRPSSGTGDPGDHPQQRALPRPVAPDDTHGLPLGEFEGHVPQGPELAVAEGRSLPVRPALRMIAEAP